MRCKGVTADESRRQEEGRVEPCFGHKDISFESHAHEDLDSEMGLKMCVERGERRGGMYEACF